MVFGFWKSRGMSLEKYCKDDVVQDFRSACRFSLINKQTNRYPNVEQRQVISAMSILSAAEANGMAPCLTLCRFPVQANPLGTTNILFSH